MPVKKSSVISRQSSEKKIVKKVVTTPSLRESPRRPKQSSTPSKQIATSPSTTLRIPRNDKKKETRVNLSVPVVGLDGIKSGTLSLPKEIFGAKVNKSLLSQALRVYFNNAGTHNANTKTRGEVRGSTRKIRAQKGTGGARHGSVRAPIFVGGGISHGPKYRKIVLDLPKKMKKAALISTLSAKAHDSEVMGITGLGKATGKTKELQVLVKKLGNKSLLIITGDKNEALSRAVGNLTKANSVLANQLSIMDLIKSRMVLMTKEAVEVLEKRINNEKDGLLK